MSVLRRIKAVLGLTPTPIRHSHVYVDQITGEPFEVTTVARNVHVERKDAEGRPEHTIRKSKMREGLDAGFIVHDEKRCPECRDDKY